MPAATASLDADAVDAVLRLAQLLGASTVGYIDAQSSSFPSTHHRCGSLGDRKERFAECDELVGLGINGAQHAFVCGQREHGFELIFHAYNRQIEPLADLIPRLGSYNSASHVQMQGEGFSIVL